MQIKAVLVITLSSLLTACGGTSPPAPRGPAPPPPWTAAEPPLRAEIFGRGSPEIYEGGDDHVALVVHNTGRLIQNLVVDLSGGDGWFGHHTLAMGTSPGCTPNLDRGRIECGPVAAGSTATIMLRAFPDEIGRFSYSAAFYSMGDLGLTAIADLAGHPAVVGFAESVIPVGRRAVLGYVEESSKPPV